MFEIWVFLIFSKNRSDGFFSNLSFVTKMTGIILSNLMNLKVDLQEIKKKMIELASFMHFMVSAITLLWHI